MILFGAQLQFRITNFFVGRVISIGKLKSLIALLKKIGFGITKEIDNEIGFFFVEWVIGIIIFLLTIFFINIMHYLLFSPLFTCSQKQ